MKLLISIFICLLGFYQSAVTQLSNEFVSGKIESKIKNMGFNVIGTMNIVAIQFKQPSNDPATWDIEGSADPATISTGIELRDKHLKKADYFNVPKYPAIHLQSAGIKSKGKNKYEGTFKLTIKETTKSLVIPLTINKDGKIINMEGEFEINRLDYGLGEESTILSDNVKVKVSAVFKIL